MSNHTPIIEKKDVVSRHLACALRLYNKQEHIDVDVYHRENKDICDRMASVWVDCGCETVEAYGRALCYAFYNFPYNPTRFNEEHELYYRFTTKTGHCFKDYWDGVVRYTQRSLDGLI